MLFRTSALVLGFFFAQNWVSYAQRLTITTDSLQFGTVTEATASPALFLKIDNPASFDQVIDSLKTFQVYSEGVGSVGKPFSILQTKGLLVPSGGSLGAGVFLAARHNLTYASSALACSQGFPGCRSVPIAAKVQYRKAYYAGTQGLWGKSLYDALKATINAGTTPGTYNTARDAMFMTIDNQKTNGQGASTNTLECVYTGRQITGYASRGDAQNQNFNTEHTFPQSLFNSALPMLSDLHHLFPTDNTPNNQRSNYPFDTVTSAPSYSVGGSKLGTNGGKTVFEPRIQQKGRTARAMCYFVTKYQDYNAFFAGQENTLRRWSLDFGPDTVDLRRNADVQTFQGNRNPFVDYPQFLDRIPSLVNPSQPFPAISKLTAYPDSGTLSDFVLQDSIYFFTLVNEGNTVQTLSWPALTNGLKLFPSALPGQLQVGAAFTFEVRIGTAQRGLYNLPLAPGVSIKVLVDGEAGTKPNLSSPFHLSPNPATQSVDIEATGLVYIANTLGQEVYRGLAGKLDISAWPKGVYLIRNLNRHQRLVVQ